MTDEYKDAVERLESWIAWLILQESGAEKIVPDLRKTLALLKRYREGLESFADPDWWDMETPTTAEDYAKQILGGNDE